MRILLDTCVLSELRQPQANPNVQRAVESVSSDDIFLSVITTGELTKGLSLLKESKRKSSLRDWILVIERFYADRVLAIDLETSHIWGEITAVAQRAGRPLPAADGLIAATALRHGLHLMTRNDSHFHSTGVLLLNPWKG